MSAVPPVDWEEIDLDPASLKLFEFTPYGPTEVMDQLASMWQLQADGVLLASSASHAHFCFAASLAGPGGKVVYEVPGYLPLIDALSVTGVEAIPFAREVEQDYRIDVDRLAQTVEENDARVVLLTNLHNPSGVQLSPQEIEGIVSIAENCDCYFVIDEMYRPFIDPDPGPMSKLHRSIVSIGGINKVHGVSQVRFGWGLATEELVDLARCVFDSTTLHNSCLTDQVARAVMKRYEPLRQRGLRFASEGWQLFSSWLEGQPLEVVKPAGGLVCFARLPGVDGDQLTAICAEQGVQITPGRFFGAPQQVRIGFGIPPEQLQPALDALGRVLATVEGR